MSGRKEKKAINLIGNSKGTSRKKVKGKKVSRRKNPQPSRQQKTRTQARSSR